MTKAIALCMLLFLAACGGGGGGGGGGSTATDAGKQDQSSPVTPPTSTPPSQLSPTASNAAPTLTGSPAVYITVGNTYSFQPLVVDRDNDQLTFTIQNLPDWASFDSRNGLLSGSPSTGDIGTYNGIVITVSDGTASTATVPFSIRVEQPAVQTPDNRKYHPGHYVQLYKTDGPTQMIQFIKPNVVGMIKRYSWKELEPAQGVYDFSKMQADMDGMARQGMRMIVVVEDRSFDMTKPLPLYMDKYNLLNSGIVRGYTAKRWDPFVIARFKALFDAMGNQFDSQPYFEGVGIQESSLGLPDTVLAEQGYTPELYRDALINILKSGADAFPTSRMFWYMNYLAGNQSYLADVAAAVAADGVVMGGPDLLPDAGLLKKMTYPLYTQFKDKMKLFTSVQFDSYRHLHKSPDAATKYWTMEELLNFARNELHVNYLFWSRTTAPSPSDAYHWPDAVPVIGANPVIN